MEVNELSFLSPHLVLSAASILVMMMTFFFPHHKKENRALFTWVTVASLVLAIFFVVKAPTTDTQVFGLVIDSLGKLFSVVILTLSALATPLLVSKQNSLKDAPSGILSLLLISALGGVVMATANDLLLVFVGLELLSIPLYILCSLGKDRKKSTEAGFKYFLLGAISSSIFVYGIAMVWGTTHSMSLTDIGTTLRNEQGVSVYTIVGFALLFAGMAFKLGFAPFHFWVLDVYQGAPAAVAGWMSGLVKAACFAFLLRLLAQIQPVMSAQWAYILVLMSVFSMVVGSFAALRQHDVKRILAYSTVSHVGYLLLALLSLNDGLQATTVNVIAFYVFIYGLASLTSFAVLIPEEALGSTKITSLSGLLKRQPVLAVCLGIGLMSLAGLPPLGGFLGKFQVFQLAFDKGYLLPCLIALLTSVVSLGYYLRLLIPSFMEPNHHADIQVEAPFASSMMVYLAMFFIVILGVYPKVWFELIKLVSP